MTDFRCDYPCLKNGSERNIFFLFRVQYPGSLDMCAYIYKMYLKNIVVIVDKIVSDSSIIHSVRNF